MTDINQREGQFIQVPHSIYQRFSKDRDITGFFEALANKINGATFNLEDVEQTSTVPFMSMVQYLERRIIDLEKDAGNKSSLSEIRRDLEDLKRSV